MEGDELFGARVDVIVCDGFAGNVALKVSEGLAKYFFQSLQLWLSGSLFRKLLASLLQPLLTGWRDKFNPAEYNGAMLLGLKKIVIKSHGGASVNGYIQAFATAREQVLANIPGKIESYLR